MNNYKLHAIITVAPSCAGKSSFASQFMEEHKDDKYINLERDKIRFELFNEGTRDWSKYKFNKKNEALVTEEYNKRLDYALTYGYNLILSDTWLNTEYRENILQRLEDEGYCIEIKDDWDIKCFEDLVKRNENREGGIGINILWDQYIRYLEYKGTRNKYEALPDKPKAIIVDIDGTVASMEGIRKPYEWDKVIYDDPITEVVDIVKGLYEKEYKIIFLSGRDGCCEDQTLAWLYDVFPDMKFSLYMRETKDCRKDYIVKEELFDTFLREHYDVRMVIDDRNSVLDLWAKLGIKTIDVSNRHERF